jgi:cytoskeletal protein RodZ
MWLFGKKQEETVSKTAAAPGQPRMWTVWLLSIATFIVTILIVLGLFWAGRWIVHQFTKQPAPTPTKTGQNTSTNNRGAAPAPQAQSGTTNNSGTSSGSSSSTSPTTTPAPNSSPSSNSSSQTSQNLVNTGPTSDD